MRRVFDLAYLVVGGLGVLLILYVGLVPRTPPSSDCGCVNKATCTEPCSSCCGPHGLEDCFKNPSPTAAASGSCCGGHPR